MPIPGPPCIACDPFKPPLPPPPGGSVGGGMGIQLLLLLWLLPDGGTGGASDMFMPFIGGWEGVGRVGIGMGFELAKESPGSDDSLWKALVAVEETGCLTG